VNRHKAFAIGVIWGAAVFGTGLTLWSIANGVGVHGTCYDMPLGMQNWLPPLTWISPGGCLPVDYAGDMFLTLMALLSIAILIIVVKMK